MTLASRRVCGGCGRETPELVLAPRCPSAGDGGDHVLLRELDEARMPFGLAGDPRHEDRPFLRWRHRLHAFHLAQARGISDDAFVALVERLERAVQAVDGTTFQVTPLLAAGDLGEHLGRADPILVKDETHNVAGSHKARHLFGILLALEALGVARDAPLAIASCGNAALAASVLAKAAGRPIRVFIPTDASPVIVRRLTDLGAELVVCERTPGEPGDPCVLRFREAVSRGAVPFSCQGSDNGLAIEGGETLGWEIAAQLDMAPIDRLFVQVGGGALGSAVGRSLTQALRAGALARMPRIHAVQTHGVHPFARAYDRLAAHLSSGLGVAATGALDDLAFQAARADRLARAFDSQTLQSHMRDAARRRGEYMWPWEHAAPSRAHGILDDETYDWLQLAHVMLASGGFPLLVDEPTLARANALGVATTGVDADETGTAGLAGLLALDNSRALPSHERCLVLFTGAHPKVRPGV